MVAMTTRAERREAQNVQRQQKLLIRMDSAVATNFILVRHGQTSWNAEMRLQGHQDPELNNLGHDQAKELAAALRDEPFNALYSSDLRRAVQTAEAIAAARPGEMQIRITEGLRERRLGVLEGLTLSEAAVQQPEAFQLLRNQADDVALPGGESPNEMRQRVVGELQRIASQHPGETVLVVVHGGVMHVVHRHAVGRRYPGPIANASLHRVRVAGAHWAVVQWDAGAPGSAVSFGGGEAEG